MNDETNSRGISRRDMMRMLAGTGMMAGTSPAMTREDRAFARQHT